MFQKHDRTHQFWIGPLNKKANDILNQNLLSNKQFYGLQMKHEPFSKQQGYSQDYNFLQKDNFFFQYYSTKITPMNIRTQKPNAKHLKHAIKLTQSHVLLDFKCACEFPQPLFKTQIIDFLIDYEK